MVNEIKGTVPSVLRMGQHVAGIVEGVIKSPDLISIPMVEDYLVLACGKDHPFASLTSFQPSGRSLP